MDIEPDVANQAMANMTFQDCRSIGNRGSGFSMYLAKSNTTTPPVDVVFRRCLVDGTGEGGFDIGSMAPGVGVGGTGVVIEGCWVRNTTSWGLDVFDKAATGRFLLSPVPLLSPLT